MDDPAYQEARRRVLQRLIMRIAFGANAVFFTAVLIEILTSSRDRVMGGIIWSAFWGTILVVHAIVAFNLFRQRIDRAVLREMELQRLSEKPKRQQLSLGEDGELVDAQAERQDFAEESYSANYRAQNNSIKR